MMRTQQHLMWTPRAKARPRTTFKGSSYRTFTPRETVAAEAALAAQWVGPPTEGPVRVEIIMTDTAVDVLVTETADCVAKKLRRGDIDNYAKLIMDALNGKAWVDDRHIVDLRVVKS